MDNEKFKKIVGKSMRYLILKYTVILGIVAYGLTGFIFMEANPVEWPAWGRLIFIVVLFFIWLAVWAVFISVRDDLNKNDTVKKTWEQRIEEIREAQKKAQNKTT